MPLQPGHPNNAAGVTAGPAHAGRQSDLWIFGYGSLMWRAGFAYAETARARLDGYHRAFCISSTHHRGNAKRPGLVLGLDRGGACEGVAFRVAGADRGAVLAYLRRRELISGVYRESHVPIVLDRGALADGKRRSVVALAYTVERCHPSYTGRLPLKVQAHQIRGAYGISGNNLDYLLATVAHLAAAGVREPELERLVALCAPHAANLMRGAHTCISAAPIRRATAHLPDPARRMDRDGRTRFLYRMRLNGGA